MDDVIVTIINQILETDSSWKEKMTNGGCYKFAKLLKTIQPHGNLIKVQYQLPESIESMEPIYHILYQYEDKLYDINGDVTHLYKEPIMLAPLANEDIIKYRIEEWNYTLRYIPKHVGIYE